MGKQINILMIDDDEEDFIIARDLFSEIDPRRYIISWAPSYKEGLAHISET